MKHLLFIPLWVICSLMLNASWSEGRISPKGAEKEIVFSGRVVDSSSGSPLVGATVLVRELRAGAVTDINGAFVLRVPPALYTVTVSYLGYGEVTERLACRSSLHRVYALATSSIELPEVRIEESYRDAHMVISPRSMAILAHEDLNRMRGQTIGETLKDLPGVTVLQTGPAISKPVIRGLHSQRVVVINNGLPQEGQQWGSEHAPEIDPFSADRVEVIRGAAGVQYGMGAIGGVILVDPAPLRSKPGYSGSLNLNGFSNNCQGATSLFLEAAPHEIPGLAIRVQGSLRVAGSASTPDEVIGNSAFREFNYSVAGGYRTDRAEMELFTGRFDTEIGVFRGAHFGNAADLFEAIQRGRPAVSDPFTYEIAAPRQRVTHDLVGLRGGWVFPRLGRVNLTLGRQVNRRQEYDAHRRYFDTVAVAARPAFDLELTSWSGDLSFRHQPIGEFYGSLGISARHRTNVGASTAFLIPNYQAMDAGFYLLETWDHEALTLNLGARIDWMETRIYAYAPKSIPDTTHQAVGVSASAGMIWRLMSPLTLGVTVGTAWRAPGVNEWYSEGVHHGAAQFEIGDRNLDAEKNLGMDAALRFDNEDLYMDVGAWGSWFSNFISLTPELPPTLTLRGIFPTARYRQSRAVLAGLDGTLRWSFLHGQSLGCVGSLVRGTNMDRDEPLVLIPADRLRLFYHVHLPDWGILAEPYVELGVLLVARQDRVPEAQDYAPPPEAYQLTDLELGGEVNLGIQIVRIQMSVRNLLNIRYRDYLSRFRYFVNDPGRDIAVRLHIPLGSIE